MSFHKVTPVKKDCKPTRRTTERRRPEPRRRPVGHRD